LKNGVLCARCGWELGRDRIEEEYFLFFFLAGNIVFPLFGTGLLSGEDQMELRDGDTFACRSRASGRVLFSLRYSTGNLVFFLSLVISGFYAFAFCGVLWRAGIGIVFFFFFGIVFTGFLHLCIVFVFPLSYMAGRVFSNFC
jgi:hypothetical protein